MAEEDIQFPVPARLLDPAQCPEPYVKSYAQYKEMHRQSIENPDEFFGKVNIITLHATFGILFFWSPSFDHVLRGIFSDKETSNLCGQVQDADESTKDESSFSHPWLF